MLVEGNKVSGRLVTWGEPDRSGYTYLLGSVVPKAKGPTPVLMFLQDEKNPEMIHERKVADMTQIVVTEEGIDIEAEFVEGEVSQELLSSLTKVLREFSGMYCLYPSSNTDAQKLAGDNKRITYFPLEAIFILQVIPEKDFAKRNGARHG